MLYISPGSWKEGHVKFKRLLAAAVVFLLAMTANAELFGPDPAPWTRGMKRLRSAHIREKKYDAEKRRMSYEAVFVYRDGTREICPLLDTTAFSFIQTDDVEGTWAAVWPVEDAGSNDIVRSRRRYLVHCRVVVRTARALEAWQQAVDRATLPAPDVVPALPPRKPSR